MRTYTVLRVEHEGEAPHRIAVGDWSIDLPAGQDEFEHVPEIVAVRAAATGHFEIHLEEQE